MGKKQKITNIILCLTFIAFAIIQLNDPDGLLWFSIYFIVAILCLAPSFKKMPIYLYWLIFFSLISYAAFHFSLFIDYLQTDNKEEIFGKMVYEKPYLEGSREFLGLLIAAAAIFYQIKANKK